jgi:hypothetical protein
MPAAFFVSAVPHHKDLMLLGLALVSRKLETSRAERGPPSFLRRAPIVARLFLRMVLKSQSPESVLACAW